MSTRTDLPLNSDGFVPFLVKWTPRAAAVAVGGYYGLGIAYEYGVMALIDKVAIQVLKYFFGYAGIGYIMPSAQWYAAWGVRVVAGLGTGLVYDLAEKAIVWCWGRNYGHNRPRQHQETA